MKNWFVAYTQPSKEQLAQQHLKDQGFEVYLPQFKKIRRHARKVEEILSPLFPRYIFVKMDAEITRWRSINGTRGISYILMNNEQPAKAPTHMIENLRAQENIEGFVTLNSLIPFIKGEKLRILEGAFKDCTAIFEKFDCKQRVQLLLNFLGREIKCTVDINAVENL